MLAILGTPFFLISHFFSAYTSQQKSRSISEIIRSFQRNEKLLLILQTEASITLYDI